MASFLRTLSSPSSALPAVVVVASAASLSSSSSSTSFSPSISKLHQFSCSSSLPCRAARLCLFGGSRSLSSTPAAAAAFHMSSVTAEAEQKNGELPELLTEFMVDMKCDGCVSAVKNKLEKLDGVKRVDVDLGNQVVRVLGSLPVKTMDEALEQTGRKARLIGQGNPEDFLVSAAVAEFKGPTIFGVVRLAQVNMELARIETNFSGLSPGNHRWSINEFGDLTRGAASTGNIFNPGNHGASEQPIGDLGTLEVQENGEANYTGAKKNLRVVDLIGRSIVVYGTEDKSDPGIAAAVIARSAGVGENYKKLCTCDGVTIWESS